MCYDKRNEYRNLMSQLKVGVILLVAKLPVNSSLKTIKLTNCFCYELSYNNLNTN